VVHVQAAESDHCALLIRLQRTGWMHGHGRRRERPFRYKNMWNCHETYESTVAAAWVPGCSSLEAILYLIINCENFCTLFSFCHRFMSARWFGLSRGPI
jgi:hypothetical protein